MTQGNLYLDINILQTVPSSNLNRDDTGAPKTALYGGVTRARVSSQSWKRAVRQAFLKESNNAEWLRSFRTKKVPLLLSKEIRKNNSEINKEDADQKVADILKSAGIKAKKDKKTGELLTGALLLVSKAQIRMLAQYALKNEQPDKKEVKKIFKDDNSLDLALFGRMVADNPDLNVDAACQVAHAISTHEVVPEFDYFTAVDDEKDDETAGSAMIGTLEYNSSTLYRYANINLQELEHNIGADLAVKGATLFLKDFITTMPTGKENTFANKTLPQYVLVTLRDDTPVNLVSAFEEPIKSKTGYVEKSIQALESELKETDKFVDKPLFTSVLTTKDSTLENQEDNLSSLSEKVAQIISERLNKDEDNRN